MPTYVYAYLDEDGRPTDETFEWYHSMHDAVLRVHPENGRPCAKAIVAPHIQASSSEIIDWQLGALPHMQKTAHDQTPACTEFTKEGAAVFHNARDRDRAMEQLANSRKKANNPNE